MTMTSNKVNFIRNFLSLFATFYALQVLPIDTTALLYVHLIFTLFLFQMVAPNYKLAFVHYLSGFAILVYYPHTDGQKVVNLILSVAPYAFHESVLSKVANS